LKISQSVRLMFITLLIGMCIIAGGCGTYAKKPTPNTYTPPNTTLTPGATSPGQLSSQEISNKAAMEAVKVSGVNSAAAIVSDQIIYVGLDLNADVDKAKAAEIEKNVLDRVATLDHKYTAKVTSDKNIVAAIKTVSQGTLQGKSMSNFNNEMHMITTNMK